MLKVLRAKKKKSNDGLLGLVLTNASARKLIEVQKGKGRNLSKMIQYLTPNFFLVKPGYVKEASKRAHSATSQTCNTCLFTGQHQSLFRDSVQSYKELENGQ